VRAPGSDRQRQRISQIAAGPVGPEGWRQLFEYNHAEHGTSWWSHVLEEVLEPRYSS
jgi:hypothetical protein